MINFCPFNVNPSITKVTLDRFSKKENQEKSYRLMNRERQKQTRALFHLFLCQLWIFFFELVSSILLLIYICFLCLTRLWPTFQSYIPQKHPRTICSPAPPEGINWEHHQPNEIIIYWSLYDQYPYFTLPGNTQKTKSPMEFSGGGDKNRKINCYWFSTGFESTRGYWTGHLLNHKQSLQL